MNDHRRACAYRRDEHVGRRRFSLRPRCSWASASHGSRFHDGGLSRRRGEAHRAPARWRVPRRAGQSVTVRGYDGDRAGRVVEHALADRAEQGARKRVPPAAADHEQMLRQGRRAPDRPQDALGSPRRAARHRDTSRASRQASRTATPRPARARAARDRHIIAASRSGCQHNTARSGTLCRLGWSNPNWSTASDASVPSTPTTPAPSSGSPAGPRTTTEGQAARAATAALSEPERSRACSCSSGRSRPAAKHRRTRHS